MKIKIKNFERWNDEMFRKYGNENRYIHSSFFVRYNTKKRMKFILDMVDAKKTDDIIELGCGAGIILKNIEYYKSITGVDFSDSALENARMNLRKKKNVSLIKGDIQELDLKLKYDKIICAEVLEHVPEPGKVIGSILKLSKKDSIIVLSVPDEKNISRIYSFLAFFGLNRVFGGISIKMDWHIHEFNMDMFKDTVKDRLKILDVRKCPVFFFPISYIIKCQIK